MCGVAGLFGSGWQAEQLHAMVASQHHRGPDARGTYFDSTGEAALGHNRLSIIDLSPAGIQPMFSADARLCIVFNGEIYNYLELRAELGNYSFRSRTDTEVILAAYDRWGETCLERFIGMFAFIIWDTRERRLFAARDRFGVKPLYFHAKSDDTLAIASEIGALHAAGIGLEPDEVSWATYLATGAHDHGERTFWQGIRALPPGHKLTLQHGRTRVSCWYDIAERLGSELDQRPAATVWEEYLTLLKDSVSLRFRADVPVGINLSGGVDSSTLLGLVQAVQGIDSEVAAFTFATGDLRYDELPWVEQMLAHTKHASVVCSLAPEDVPALADSVQMHQREPFGGIPTLAYARLFEQARARGVIVLLDGQGMDEQWAGYDYYRSGLRGEPVSFVQGTTEKVTRSECLTPDFRALAKPFVAPRPFSDALRNLQYRDTRFIKIPRALRFNDRVSMRASTELREPFLDHRLFELAMRQPAERKINEGTGKWLLRKSLRQTFPHSIMEAPKRSLQTPQREWLRGPLREWADQCIGQALGAVGGAWLDNKAAREAWIEYCSGVGDSSFFVWQWVSLGLTVDLAPTPCM